MHEEEARRNVQEVDDEINQHWTAVHPWTAKKMLRYLEDSESTKVTRELKEQFLSPDGSSVNKEHRRAEGGSVDPKGKTGHRSARTKVAREESEKPKEAELEVDGDVPQEESVESRSPKRKVIRVESEVTQDYVRETLAISKEEAEEMGFVPSALSEPLERSSGEESASWKDMEGDGK